MTPIELLLDSVDWEEVPDAADHGDGLPFATHEGAIEFPDGTVLKCYQLNNGERVFAADDIARFFGD